MRFFYGEKGNAELIYPERKHYDVLYFGSIIEYLISYDKNYGTTHDFEIEAISAVNILKAYIIKY